MSADTYQVTLADPRAAKQQFGALWRWVEPRLQAGQKLWISLKPAKRSMEQNARLHAMLQEISERMVWDGERRSVEVWKRLFTAAWLRARGEVTTQSLRSLDGPGVDVVYWHTSTLTTAEASELMDYIEAWVASGGNV